MDRLLKRGRVTEFSREELRARRVPVDLARRLSDFPGCRKLRTPPGCWDPWRDAVPVPLFSQSLPSQHPCSDQGNSQALRTGRRWHWWGFASSCVNCAGAGRLPPEAALFSTGWGRSRVRTLSPLGPPEGSYQHLLISLPISGQTLKCSVSSVSRCGTEYMSGTQLRTLDSKQSPRALGPQIPLMEQCPWKRARGVLRSRD